MKKFFLFDIDGTLIDCNEGVFSIPNETRECLNQLKEKGHSVFLATGRCKCFILDGVIDYPFDGYVTCNGAYVEYNEEKIYKCVVSQEAIEKTHEYCKQNSLAYYFESNENIYVLNKASPMHIQFKENWGMKDSIVVDEFDINTIETYIGMIVLEREDQIASLYETLSDYFFIQRHQQGLSFDLTIKHESKAKGIKALLDTVGATRNDAVAFGDGNNDIEMIEYVGLGIAMGTAVKPLKDIADYITTNINENGIKNALEYFNFIDS